MLYRIEYRDSRYDGTTFTGSEGATEQEAIERFVGDNILLPDWSDEIEIVSVKQLPDHI